MSQPKHFSAGDLAFTLKDLLRASEELDRLLQEAVESGVETGRSIGVIEAYNILVLNGHKAAARLVMELVEEEAIFRKAIGDA